MNGVLTVGSLFSGYGGIELGLEQTKGFRTIWHCEIEPYTSAILKERWPGIPNLGDITKVNWEEVEVPDLICGGFPCQDISVAGKGRGIIKGETRSGLWGEFHKSIRVLRPRYVLIENVSALARRGLNIVLADLAQEGYDAEWIDLRASDFGAPHKRERLFIVAYPNSKRNAYDKRRIETEQPSKMARPDSDSSRYLHGRTQEQSAEAGKSSQREPFSVCSDVSDTCCGALQGQQQPVRSEQAHSFEGEHGGWETECGLDRVAYGITKGLDYYIWRERIKALGNGVVPQVATWVGKMILQQEKTDQEERP